MLKPHNIALFFGISALLVASLASAQSLPDPIQYVVSPETPGPNQQVSIQVQGVGSFLGEATLVWTQDGKVVQSGVGARSYSFQTGPLGSQTRIHVSIDSSQGSFSHDFFFVPSAVNLVWEADTAVPPLFAGKALYSAGSELKVVAFPIVIVNGNKVPAASLSYQWSDNDNSLPDASGLGRSTFTFTGDQLQSSEDVSVDVYYGASKLAHGDIVIPASKPALVLYDKDALRGVVWEEALPSGLALSSKELTIEAFPYYFSNASLKQGSANFTWTLGDNEVTGPQSAQGILTLRQNGSGTGSAELDVSVQNNGVNKLIQAAQTALQIVFGQQQQASGVSSFFGL